MSSTNSGGSAFPPMHDPATHCFGMSLRDYFAAKAMQGALRGRFTDTRMCAEWAYEMADAMLKVRGKP